MIAFDIEKLIQQIQKQKKYRRYRYLVVICKHKKSN
jgi:hypothetical protein